MSQQQTGVILVNLGTPTSPTPAAVRQFLREFLSDRRVVDVPPVFWKPLLNMVILPLRSRRVARAYKSVWTDAGSPLRQYSQELSERLGISEKIKPVVTLAMTYGEPSIHTRVEEFLNRGIDRILVLPLYPQFSSTTTGAVYDRLFSFIKKRRNIPDIRCLHDYHDHPRYIAALASSVEKHWDNSGRSTRLLMSFHGIPESYVKAGDPYVEQCKKTANLIAEKLELKDDNWAISFQSRFGPTSWVEPYTDDCLVKWAQEGVKSVDVICPSFATDCLETLEEIGSQYADLFRRSGGDNLLLIPCLNSTQGHLELLEELIIENLF